MNRILCVLLAIICMLCFVTPAFAHTQVEDAFDIDEETRAFLSASEDDTVIRFYCAYSMYGFSQGWSLEEMLNDGWSHKYTEYLVVSEDDGQEALSYIRVKDGEIQQGSEEFNDRKQKEFTEIYKICKEPEKKLSVLGPYITTNKIVFLEEMTVDGLYIYYETSIGDYVYYRRTLESDEIEYLVPLDEFIEYAKEEQAIRSVTEAGGGSALAAKYLSDYDLSNYTLTPRKLWFTVLFCSVPALLIAGVCFFVRKRKKA